MRTSLLTVMFLLAAVPAWAGGDAFDPDQPFRQALNHRLLESLFNQAMEVIEDHLEISGNLGTDHSETGQKQSFQFKFYPEGKSKSDQHFSAEGWFGPSMDRHQQELHFRFTLPKSPADSSPLPDNVL